MDSVHAAKLLSDLSGGLAGWFPKALLGHGKSAAVFRAEKGAETAALKVFDRALVEAHGKDEQLERISREKSLVGKSHPNLIGILDAGYDKHQDLMFVVMDYLPWPNMHDVQEKIPRDAIRLLISQVASAAQYLENLGIVHRDIKPDNIVVSPDFKTACLLDLGVMRPLSKDGITDDDLFVGTHQYSPPEFILRQEDPSVLGYRAITFYQLGAVLHDLIVRKRLFAKYQKPPAVLSNAVQNAKPEMDAKDVDPLLIALSLKCLQKKPAKRLLHVAWSDFSAVPPATDAAGAARARVKKRAQAYEEEAVQEQDETSDEDKVREATESIASLIHGLTFAIHTTNSHDFPSLDAPPPEIRPPASALLRIGWGRAPSKGLTDDVWILVTLSIDDPLLQTGSCEVGVWVGTSAPDSLPASEEDRGQLFKGVFSEALLREALEARLYEILDKVQIHCETNGKSDSWLKGA